jgi:hypothetical protein
LLVPLMIRSAIITDHDDPETKTPPEGGILHK